MTPLTCVTCLRSLGLRKPGVISCFLIEQITQEREYQCLLIEGYLTGISLSKDSLGCYAPFVAVFEMDGSIGLAIISLHFDPKCVEIRQLEFERVTR